MLPEDPERRPGGARAHAVGAMRATSSAVRAGRPRRHVRAATSCRAKIKTAYRARARRRAQARRSMPSADDAVVVATTGKTARELFEHREAAAVSRTGRLPDGRLHGACVADRARASRWPSRIGRSSASTATAPSSCTWARWRSSATQKPAQFQARRLQQRRARLGRRAADRRASRSTCRRSRTACGYRVALSGAHEARDRERDWRRLREAEGPALLEIRVNKGARGEPRPAERIRRPTTSAS